MNLAEVTGVTNTFFQNQVIKRKKEAQYFYNKMIVIFTSTALFGYLSIIYFSHQVSGVSTIFSSASNFLFVLGAAFYLGACMYYLLTLLHDYVHASQYYSKKARFVMEYIVPALVPMNPSGYRWGHFQHHSNTNRFSEELDTLPPFKLDKTLSAFWFNVAIHSLFITLIFVIRIAINPLMMLSEKTRLIYFNYVSPLGRVSPTAYPARKCEKEFKRNFTANLISLATILSFWALSGFSLVFLILYFSALFISSAWISFRSLVDHACVDVKDKESARKADFYLTSNFSDKYFWYAGFATYHLVHHINSSIPHYFCKEINDILCNEYPEYEQLHLRRNNIYLVLHDFFGKDTKDTLEVNLIKV